MHLNLVKTLILFSLLFLRLCLSSPFAGNAVLGQVNSPGRQLVIPISRQLGVPPLPTTAFPVTNTALNSVQQTSLAQMNTCDTWTFQLRLGNPSSVERVTDMVQLPNHDYVLVGTTDAGASEQGLIVKLDKESNLLWSKGISLPGSLVSIKKIKYFSDGNIYVLCDVKDVVTGLIKPVLAGLDQHGTILWSHKIDIPGLAGSWKAIDVAEWREKSLSVVISNGLHFNVSRLSMQTRSTIWSKTHTSRGNLQVIGGGNEYWETYVAYKNQPATGYVLSPEGRELAWLLCI